MKIGIGDITKVKDVDVIVNAANGIGVMGAGLAGALAKSGGTLLTKAAREHCLAFGPYEAGTFYCTDAGLLKRRGVKEIYHAVTMKFPGGPTSLDVVLKSLLAVLTEAKKKEVRSIAIPGLGTGIGRLDKIQVAQRMAAIIEPFNKNMEIYIIDRNSEFIEAFKESISVEKEEYVIPSESSNFDIE